MTIYLDLKVAKDTIATLTAERDEWRRRPRQSNAWDAYRELR
jgi:hypothetical protein